VYNSDEKCVLHRLDDEKLTAEASIATVKVNDLSHQWLLHRPSCSASLAASTNVLNVTLAFPISVAQFSPVSFTPLKDQRIFAVLPVNSYGLPFIIQGEFAVTSSRDGIMEDNPINRRIMLEAVPAAFASSFSSFHALASRLIGQNSDRLSVSQAFLQYLPAVHVNGELISAAIAAIFRAVRDLPCLPAGNEYIRPLEAMRAPAFFMHTSPTGETTSAGAVLLQALERLWSSCR